MKNLIIILGFVLLSINLSAQKYNSKNGFVGFFSHTPIEDVKADNNQVASIIDAATGEVVFMINNQSFVFDRAQMQEHFNENYMESEQFPKSTFKGKIKDLSAVNFAKSGVYTVTVEGEMKMHGVANKFATYGTIEVLADGIVAKAKFNIKPEDYGIVIPGLVREKIGKEMEVTVNIKYSLLNK
jgi:polyisoprenoid-binding protein YceI